MTELSAPARLGAFGAALLVVLAASFGVGRVTGDVETAVSRGALGLEACGVSAGLDLAAGDHEVRTADGAVTGIDVDRLVLPG